MELKDQIAIAISVAALGIAGLSFVISWRVYRRQVLAERPIVAAAVNPVKDEPGWFEVKLTITNRAAHGLRMVTLSLSRPRGAKGMLRDAALLKRALNMPPQLQSPLPLDAANREVALSRFVASTGTKPQTSHGMTLSVGDKASVSLLVFVPPSRRMAMLRMRLALVSMEAVERHTEVAIARTLPQASSTADARTTNRQA